LAAIGLAGDVLVRARGSEVSTIAQVIGTEVAIITEVAILVGANSRAISTRLEIISAIISIIAAQGCSFTSSTCRIAFHGTTNISSTRFGRGRTSGNSSNVMAHVISARVIVIANYFCSFAGSVRFANGRVTSIHVSS
jgi:hypothetical protein